MGFFSGIFGTGSYWDGSKYVANVVNNKFWYNSFIDLDEMRNYGIRVAYQLDPLNVRMNEPQSAKTVVGELVFLFKECRAKEDTAAINSIVKAIIHLLEKHKNELPRGAESFLTLECYHKDIWDWKDRSNQ